MASWIHHVPDFLLTVLSFWLGLSLIVRAPRDRAARAFAWFCVNLALYGGSALLPQFTSDPLVGMGLNRLQLATTVLTPAAFLHFIAVLTTPVYLPALHRVLIGLFYATGLGLAAYALLGPLSTPLPPFAVWARWGELYFPAGPLNVAWTLQRVLPLLLAMLLMVLAYRHGTNDLQEQRLRRIFLMTTLVGVIGALAATAARSVAASPAVPRTVILVAMLVLAYAVLVHRALLPPRVALRTFFYSFLGSLITTAYVAALLLLEWTVQAWLKLDAPLVTLFSLVVLVAALGPVREWFRDQLDRRFYRREFNYGRLVRTLNNDMFERGSLDEQLQVALAAICRALGVRAGLVALSMPEGLAPRAVYGQLKLPPLLPSLAVPSDSAPGDGSWAAWQADGLVLALQRGNEELGVLALRQRRSGQPFNATERNLIDYLSNYLVLAITHTRARDAQQEAMMALAAQSEALMAQQEELARQAAVTTLQAASVSVAPEPTQGLRVYALGSLRVERDGTPITRWGGDKAGTYQAEALFAFLFDRRGKGISKDEAAELIWPELEISKADAAFHRTIAALRRTLEPGLRRGNESRTILYHRERYWLEPETVAWCDSDAFTEAVKRGTTLFRQGDHPAALALLEQAHELYRGDYMDDCPFFGDSVYVEEQRTVLRAYYVEVQLTLGALYEILGRAGEAVAAYRRALNISPEGCPAASEGLARLRVAI